MKLLYLWKREKLKRKEVKRKGRKGGKLGRRKYNGRSGGEKKRGRSYLDSFWVDLWETYLKQKSMNKTSASADPKTEDLQKKITEDKILRTEIKKI